jgi:hypothetical protein
VQSKIEDAEPIGQNADAVSIDIWNSIKSDYPF